MLSSIVYRDDNAIAWRRITQPRIARLPAGLALGSVGVLVFSFSLPATKLAVADLDPWFVAFGRAAVAGVLGAALLLRRRAALPGRAQLPGLALVSLGVIVGFPLCTSLALEHRPAGQSAVVIGVLPAMTAVMAVLRAGERPSARFWVASFAGLVTALAFAATRGAHGIAAADALLLASVAVCGLGYAEGAVLARDLGGPATICWALVLSLPLTIPVTAVSGLHAGLSASAGSWLGFAYVSVFSMFLGFFAWYAGLSRGGIARIGQVQLAQPVLSLCWAALVLGEQLGPAELVASALVLACVAATQRAR